MHRTFSKLAALIAMTAVVIGAFGTHYLKKFLSPDQMTSIQTATQYQFMHAVGLFIVANLYRHYRSKTIIWSGNAMVVGIILFSGSIYLRIFLVLEGYTSTSLVAMITPLGGLALIVSWLLLFAGIPSGEHHEHHDQPNS